MKVNRPCVTCGGDDIYIGQLELEDTANWYVKCANCVSVTTVTHAIQDGAIKQWNDQWCWNELEKAINRAADAESKENQLRKRQNEDQRVIQYRYEKVLDEYVKYRMLYSGTAGNINLDERNKLMRKEISAELGWVI